MNERMFEFSQPLVKKSYKCEVRVPGDDPDKLRNFFQVGMSMYAFCKILFEPIHDYLKCRLPFAVGFRWLGGGAPFMYDYLKGSEPGRSFFYGDISGKDKQFRAHCISVVLQTVRWLVNCDGYGLDATLFRVILKWVIDNTAYHVVNWVKGWRFVIGGLPSGCYNTSFANTMHMVIVKCAFCYHLYKKTNDPIFYYAPFTGNVRFMVGGDDFVDSVSVLLQKEYHVESFREYVSSSWLMKVKEGAYGSSRSLLTLVNPRTGEIMQEKGMYIIFNKRCLILDEGVIRPFRPLVDYVHRLIVMTKSDRTAYDYLAKYLGLLLDTLGTNVKAWNLLVYLMKETEAYIRVVEGEFVMMDFLKRLDDEAFLQERLYKMGLSDVDGDYILWMARSRQTLLDELDGVNVDPVVAKLHILSAVGRPPSFSRF